MNVEVIGRQYEVSAGLRRFVESDVSKLQGILGENYQTKVILIGEKVRRRAEITIRVPRKPPLVGLGAADGDMRSAIGQALERIEKQALKNNGRRACRREVKAEWKREPEVLEGAEAPVAPAVKRAETRPAEHLVEAQNALAGRILTIEEAAKICEEQDRELLVFRDKNLVTRVIHRTRAGKLEMVEIPKG
jgi:ribosomal subunit interface protein